MWGLLEAPIMVDEHRELEVMGRFNKDGRGGAVGRGTYGGVWNGW